MKAFITGGNGFIGTNLSRFLLREGHEVSVLVRGEKRGSGLPNDVSLVVGDSTKPGNWQDAVGDHDLLINLAGATVFKRWNDSYKKLLRDSRILTTRNLVDAIPSAGATLLNASGVGFYGPNGDHELDEKSPQGTGFLAALSGDWETEALKARDKGTRVVAMRFGVVLGKDGGALEQMVRPFRLFAGGPLGDGKQWLSWIHVEDLCRAALFVAGDQGLEGPVNFAAPQPVTNRELAKTIGKVLGRPSSIPAPAFMIRLVLGEFGSVILTGQRVVPGALESRGFSFNFPDMEGALRNLL